MTHEFILPASMMFHMQRVIAGPMASTRTYLSGVRIEPIPEGGAFLIATDGVVMLIHRARHATAARIATIAVQEPILPEAYDEWGERLDQDWSGQHIRIPEITAHNHVAAEVVYGGYEDPVLHVIAEEVGGTFPDWRQVFSADFSEGGAGGKFWKGKARDHFDHRALSKICMPWRGAKISRLQRNGPWIVTMDDDEDTIGVIAPREVKPRTPTTLTDMLTAVGRADLLEGGTAPPTPTVQDAAKIPEIAALVTAATVVCKQIDKWVTVSGPAYDDLEAAIRAIGGAA